MDYMLDIVFVLWVITSKFLGSFINDQGCVETICDTNILNVHMSLFTCFYVLYKLILWVIAHSSIWNILLPML